jgi:hypothetical protein
MKLSKNKIKQLLKVKNQSHKRIKKNTHAKHRTARGKRPVNLRHKTLRGGGLKGSKLQEATVLSDFTSYKAKLLEDKTDLNTTFKTDFSKFFDIITKLEVNFNPDIYDKGTLNRLKQIMKDSKSAEDDKDFLDTFINTYLSIENIDTLTKLGLSVNEDLENVILLLTRFLEDVTTLNGLTPDEDTYIEKQRHLIDVLNKSNLLKYNSKLSEIANLYNRIISEKSASNQTKSKNILTLIVLIKKISDSVIITNIEKYLRDVPIEDLESLEDEAEENVIELTDEPIVAQTQSDEPNEGEIRRILKEIDDEEPIAHEPIAHEPIAHEPIANEPIAHEPIAHEPIAHEPLIGQGQEQELINTLAEKISTLNNEIQELDSKKTELEQQLENRDDNTKNEMQTKINELEQKMKALESEEDILKRELADKEELMEKHAEEKTILEETINMRNNNIDELKEIINDLAQSDLKDNISPQQLEELERSRQTISELESELQITNDSLKQRDVIFEENEKSQEIIKTLQDTVASLEQNPRITEVQSDELNDLRNRINVLEGEEKTKNLNHIEKQQEVIKELQDTISSLEQNSKITKEQFDDINNIKNKVQSLTTELTYLNNELENRDSIIDEYASAAGTSASAAGTDTSAAGTDTSAAGTDTSAADASAAGTDTSAPGTDTSAPGTDTSASAPGTDTGTSAASASAADTSAAAPGASASAPLLQPTTEVSRGLQEFVVRIKYPITGSDEHVINVIGESGTSTEANIMNISREINNPIANKNEPPPYSVGGKGNTKRRKNKGFFSSEEFIKF